MIDDENEKIPLYLNFSSGNLVENEIMPEFINFKNIEEPLLILKRKIHVHKIVTFLTDKK
jgi:hypothetical protein